jgi:VCBS repeat-containing protein
VETPGVLENDMDIDGDTLTSTISNPPSHGSLTLNADGSFEYAAPNDYSGEVVFSYRAYDGDLFSQTVSVTITIEARDPSGDYLIFLPMTLR